MKLPKQKGFFTVWFSKFLNLPVTADQSTKMQSNCNQCYRELCSPNLSRSTSIDTRLTIFLLVFFVGEVDDIVQYNM